MFEFLKDIEVISGTIGIVIFMILVFNLSHILDSKWEYPIGIAILILAGLKFVDIVIAIVKVEVIFITLQ